MDLKNYVATVLDFPKKGIVFRDITPLMNSGEAYKEATDQIVNFAKEHNIDAVNLKNASLETVLDKALEGKGVSYRIEDGVVYLSKKETQTAVA